MIRKPGDMGQEVHRILTVSPCPYKTHGQEIRHFIPVMCHNIRLSDDGEREEETMLNEDIPGFGPVALAYLVSDFTGTVSVGGKLLPGVKEALNRIAGTLDIHFLTADTFGAARVELEGVDCEIHILSGEAHDAQKAAYIEKLGTEKVVALGNGNNDRRMLREARIGIAVSEGEGCAVDAITSADIHVKRAMDALDLLLDTRRLKATLRF